MLMTRRDNIGGLLHDRAFDCYREKIPRTIRDTISFIDQLGIRCLWVDALCIIQDDAESKHDQIRAMAGIYANSYVTVIAGNGWDADHGLRGFQGVTKERNLSSFSKSDINEISQPFSSIWYTRGWTFQEMVFSPRKIVFQYQLALWECSENAWHESSLSTNYSMLNASRLQPSINP